MERAVFWRLHPFGTYVNFFLKKQTFLSPRYARACLRVRVKKYSFYGKFCVRTRMYTQLGFFSCFLFECFVSKLAFMQYNSVQKKTSKDWAIAYWTFKNSVGHNWAYYEHFSFFIDEYQRNRVTSTNLWWKWNISDK